MHIYIYIYIYIIIHTQVIRVLCPYLQNLYINGLFRTSLRKYIHAYDSNIVLSLQMLLRLRVLRHAEALKNAGEQKSREYETRPPGSSQCQRKHGTGTQEVDARKYNFNFQCLF